MMQKTRIEFAPRFWLLDEPPYYTRLWLFKTSLAGGCGTFVSKQKNPSGVTLRIITAGKWTIKMSGQTLSAGPGDIFLALPGIPVEFCHRDTEHPWEWYELQLSGSAASRFVLEFNLSEQHPVSTPLRPAAAIRIFKLLYRMMGSPGRDVLTLMNWLFRLTQVCDKPAIPQADCSLRSDSRLVAQAMLLIETELDGNLNVNVIAQRLGVDRTTLGRAFKKRTGNTPHAVIDSFRLMKVQEILRNTALPLAVIARTAGFRDEKYFISWFKKKTGATPDKWRKIPTSKN